MKMKNLLKMAKEQVIDEQGEQAVKVLKKSLKRIEDCKKTLRVLEREHKKLLEKDLDDLELEDYDY